MASTTHDHRRGVLRHMHWLALAPAAAFALMTMATPSDNGPTLCPVALFTGMACPGCGMSRAMAWLLRGDLERSISYHPLAPLVLIMGLITVVWILGRRLRGWKAPGPAVINSALMGLAVLLVAVWVTRFINGTLPVV
jgi:hypothetical protein